jgi:hypothetical protein
MTPNLLALLVLPALVFLFAHHACAVLDFKGTPFYNHRGKKHVEQNMNVKQVDKMYFQFCVFVAPRSSSSFLGEVGDKFQFGFSDKMYGACFLNEEQRLYLVMYLSFYLSLLGLSLPHNLFRIQTCLWLWGNQAMNRAELQRQGRALYLNVVLFSFVMLPKEKPNGRDVLLTRLPLRGGGEAEKQEEPARFRV